MRYKRDPYIVKTLTAYSLTSPYGHFHKKDTSLLLTVHTIPISIT